LADDTFLLGCLNNADIKPFVTGAAQPKLSQANLRQIEINVQKQTRDRQMTAKQAKQGMTCAIRRRVVEIPPMSAGVVQW
jgi:hypothetical protein